MLMRSEINCFKMLRLGRLRKVFVLVDVDVRDANLCLRLQLVGVRPDVFQEDSFTLPLLKYRLHVIFCSAILMLHNDAISTVKAISIILSPSL